MSWMFVLYFLLLFPRCPASDENLILQEPTVITAEEGESVTITCHFNHPEVVSLYLRRRFVQNMGVLFTSGYGENTWVEAGYEGRIEYINLNKTATITLQQLQRNHTDAYICDGNVLINQEPKSVQGRGTLLVVTAKKLMKCSSSSWMLYVLLVETMLLVTTLGYFFLSCVDAKKYCQKGKGKEAQNMVYEDMTYSLRRNTVDNQYEY